GCGIRHITEKLYSPHHLSTGVRRNDVGPAENARYGSSGHSRLFRNSVDVRRGRFGHWRVIITSLLRVCVSSMCRGGDTRLVLNEIDYMYYWLNYNCRPSKGGLDLHGRFGIIATPVWKPGRRLLDHQQCFDRRDADRTKQAKLPHQG